MRSLAHGLFALAAAGCTQVLDLGGGGDAGLGASDALATDAPLDAPDGSSDACAADVPELIVGMRSIAPAVDNAIARFALGPSGWERCPDLLAERQLPHVQAVGWIDDGRIVVGSDAGLWLVDARSDRLLGEWYWVDGPRYLSVDAFGLDDPMGGRWGALAVEYVPRGGVTIDRLYMINADTTERRVLDLEMVESYRLTGCDASPTDPTAIVCGEPITVTPPYGTEAAAKEIHPWPGGAPTAHWIPVLPGTQLRRLDALGDRIVWIGNTAMADHVRRSVGGLMGTVSGPLRCSTAVCESPWRLVDVANDPSRPGGYFAICRGAEPTDTRDYVIRGDADADGAPCEVLLDGSALPMGVDPTSLDVRMP
jgi:hypothetical protein